MKNKIVLSYRFIILVYYLLAFLIVIMNINHLERVLKKLIPKVSKIENVAEDMKLLGLDSFNASSMTYKVLLTTKPYKYFNVKREFNRMLKETFDKEGIEIPYNQIDVHVKEK